MRVIGRAAAWSLLGMGLLSCTSGDYAVRLDRPWAAGHRYAVQGFIQHDVGERGRVGQPLVSRRLLSLDMIARVQVVSPRGNLRRVELSVRKLAYVGRRAATLLAAGAVVSAVLDSRPATFLVNGKQVPEAAQQELQFLFPYRADDEPSDDDSLGSPPLRRAGESWAIHRDLAARARPFGLIVDAKDIDGSVSLRGTKTVGGRPWLNLRLIEQGRNATLDRRLSPDGVDTLVPWFVADVRSSLPLDPAVEGGSVQRLFRCLAVLQTLGDDGSPIRIERSVRDISHVRWEAVK